jgi:hypothetical protein
MKAVTIFVGGLITVATVGILVSSRSQTPRVLGASGQALSGSLAAAEGR